MKTLIKYSMGVGDRFGQQGSAQLEAFRLLHQNEKVLAAPVWNKSNREHTTVGTHPDSVRQEADAAITSCRWDGAYYVDADHINLKNVSLFTKSADFFTLDVADFIGETMDEGDIYGFLARHENLVGTHEIEGLGETLTLTRHQAAEYLRNTLFAIRQAGRIYEHIVSERGNDDFVTEVSMDETDMPQTPLMLLVILAAIAEEGIPAQTIAPKFSGRFNKGVDYVGDPDAFGIEFEQDVCVARYAAKRFGLPANLKLSVHSGSDKFSLYPHIARVLKQHEAGVHIKTAGTTWLEEVIGLAASDGEGLDIAREIYALALSRFEELCGPYAAVIDVHPDRLPSIAEVQSWSGEHFAATLRHVPSEARFNSDFRQFMHVSYKIAAELGDRYLQALAANETTVSAHVTENIYQRHLKPIFGTL
ncbi:MAG: tagaturonate epimerase family protein [Kiritimatiellae bacterium]|nr:tagaturonate epimerase family protein [Kiritimatiellia bacterium]